MIEQCRCPQVQLIGEEVVNGSLEFDLWDKLVIGPRAVVGPVDVRLPQTGYDVWKV